MIKAIRQKPSGWLPPNYVITTLVHSLIRAKNNFVKSFSRDNDFLPSYHDQVQKLVTSCGKISNGCNPLQVWFLKCVTESNRIVSSLWPYCVLLPPAHLDLLPCFIDTSAWKHEIIFSAFLFSIPGWVCFSGLNGWPDHLSGKHNIYSNGLKWRPFSP